ncbi:phosphatidylcholine transfer protein [Rhynchocyon petersi]
MAEAAGDGFSEAQFQKACDELQQPVLGNAWELLVETTDVKVYRLLDEKTWLYEYKAFGVLDCPADLLAEVYMDLAYRKQWDTSVCELYEKQYNGKTIVYWEVNYPFPMYNRDYVYFRQWRELEMDGQKVHVILARSTSVPQIPEKSGVIRVTDYRQSLAIQSDGNKRSKIFMHYFDNPGGQIPTWIINWIAKSGVPSFLDELVEACRKYPKKT